MTTNAIATLTAAFDATFTSPGYGADRDRPAVVLSWPSVPIEIVRAAGLRPIVVRGGAIGTAATPAADAHLEPEIFPSRLRYLVDAALTGRLDQRGAHYRSSNIGPGLQELPLPPGVCAPGHRALAPAHHTVRSAPVGRSGRPCLQRGTRAGAVR